MTVSVKRRENSAFTARERPEEEERRGPKPVHVQRLSEIQSETVDWLWYPYIPAGKLVMLEGDPGLGKSWITCALAADISAGRALPGQEKALPPQKVLMLSAEDGLGDTVRPRIEAMHGNLENIFVSDDYFVLDEYGLKQMENMMRETAATIVFMDPIVAYMGGKIDMHKANEVRGLMGPLSESAKRTGTALVAVRHLRKGGGANAKYRGIGSIDFTAAVRSALQVGESEDGSTYMAHVKHNLSPKGDTLGYEVRDGAFHWTGVFNEHSHEIAEGLVSTRPRGHAEQWLRDRLRDGPVLAADVQVEAASSGITAGTLRNAKKGLNVISLKENGVWVWTLPERLGMSAVDLSGL